jgi:hypothetical protein
MPKGGKQLLNVLVPPKKKEKEVLPAVEELNDQDLDDSRPSVTLYS